MRKLIFVFSFLAVLVGVLFFIISHFTSPEYKARSVVEKHLLSIKNGTGNPYEYLDTGIKEIFVNVLNYKFLTHLSTETVPHYIIKDTDYINYRKECDEPKAKLGIDVVFSDIHKTPDEVCASQSDYERNYYLLYKKLYGEDNITTENNRMKVLTGYYNRCSFLYDLELTNKLGTKLYKKYIFEVDKFLFGYRIVNFYER